MRTRVAAWIAALAALTMTAAATAKIPDPSDEGKAKAAEAAAKTAHAGKVDSYKLCLAMDKVAAHYLAEAKKAGKDPKPTAGLPPCADPGAFVYTPVVAAAPAAGAAPAAAPTPPAPAAAPAAASAAPKK